MPTLFVLIGFVVFKFASPQRNLDSITLDVSAFNSDVSAEPIFPLPFNSPDNPYRCQPGKCAYEHTGIEIPETNEFYAFCGSQVTLEGEAVCTISVSTEIAFSLDSFEGITTIETDVTSVETVSSL